MKGVKGQNGLTHQSKIRADKFFSFPDSHNIFCLALVIFFQTLLLLYFHGLWISPMFYQKWRYHPSLQIKTMTKFLKTRRLDCFNLKLFHKLSVPIETICDTLGDLTSFVQFKKRENYPWRSVTFSKVGGFAQNEIFERSMRNETVWSKFECEHTW